jgi:hypothetical protein
MSVSIGKGVAGAEGCVVVVAAARLGPWGDASESLSPRVVHIDPSPTTQLKR